MTTDLLFDSLQQIDIDNIIDDQDEKRLDTLEKKKRTETRQNKRIEDCGKWANWYDPHTGRRTGFTFKCGLFRQCPTCLTARADEEHKWMQQASLNKRMVMIKDVDKSRATKLLRGVDKADYVRYPQENGDLIIVNEDVGISGESIDLSWVVEQDWEEIVCTPKGRNKSGTIHVPVSDEEVKEFSIITTKQFITNATRQQTIQTMDAVVAETRQMKPTTPDAVVSALNKRIALTTKKLKADGYIVHVYSKQLKLVHDDINWGEVGVGLGVIKRVKTENPTRLMLKDTT